MISAESKSRLRSAPRRSGGFTLVELLAATALLMLMVVLFFEIISQMTRVGETSRAEVDRLDKVGVAFDMIRRDLAAALPPIVPSSTNSLQFLLNPETPLPAETRSPHSVFWQAPVATASAGSDVATVGYFIRRDESVSPPRSSLCRLQVNPGDTSPDGESLYLLGSSPEWISGAILDACASGKAPEYDGLVVEDALALWVRAVDEDGGCHYRWNSRPTPGAPNPLQDGKLPRALEIALVVADSRTAGRLDSLPEPEAGESAEAFDAEVEVFLKKLPPGVRVFRSTFPLYPGR